MTRSAHLTVSSLIVALLMATALPWANAQQRGGEVTMSRQSAMDLLEQLEALQTEVRQLRNTVELQTNELERIKAAQRDLLVDIDQRLTALERGAEQVAATPAPRPSAAPSPGPATTPGASPPPVAAVTPPVRTPATAQERREYDAAFSLLKQGLYTRASDAFRAFTQKYPNSTLAGNSQYWTAEANYVVRNFGVALDEFNRVVTNYPESAKVPDALLKVGYSYYELKNYDKACQTLNDVVTRYPNTTVARLAEIRLAKMKEEGHAC
jgi:tol-pal system protein YbgF